MPAYNYICALNPNHITLNHCLERPYFMCAPILHFANMFDVELHDVTATMWITNAYVTMYIRA